MADGGGVPGRAAGTAIIIMTEAGLITEVYRLFTVMFLQAGEKIERRKFNLCCSSAFREQ